jgi:hypothetical protein
MNQEKLWHYVRRICKKKKWESDLLVARYLLYFQPLSTHTPMPAVCNGRTRACPKSQNGTNLVNSLLNVAFFQG